MTHARKSLRDRVATAVTSLSTTGTKVYKSRVFPLADENLPGLLVFTSIEEINEDEGKQARYQFRNLNIVVEGYDKLSSGLDDKLDTIAEEVETALFAAGIGTFDLLTTETSFEEGLEKTVGKITLTFRAQYITQEGAPGTAL